MEQAKISSSHGAQQAHAARPRSGAPAADTADAGGAGGFLALLASLGEPALADGAAPGDALIAEAGTPQVALPVAGAVPFLAGADTQAVAILPAEADAYGAAEAAALASLQGLLVPSADGRPASGALSTALDGVLGGGASVSAFTATLLGADGTHQGLVAETALLDTSADLKGGPAGAAPGAAPGFARAFARAHSSAMTQQADALAAASGRVAAGDSGRLLVPQPLSAVAGSTFQIATERLVAGVPLERAPAGSAGLSGTELAPLMDSTLAAGTAGTSARGGESAGGGRSGDGTPNAMAWSDALGAASPQEAGGLDAAAVLAEPGHAGAEEQVADQVAYWVHQKTQNAEITLDRDGQPVEVLVTLSGNEAHVSFRSDQAQTRDLLDRSMAQLSELLRGEGLVLSGMSVGTSAGHGTGSGEQQRQREGARQAQVVTATPAGSAPLLRGKPSPDHAVDVFV